MVEVDVAKSNSKTKKFQLKSKSMIIAHLNDLILKLFNGL